MSLSITFLSRLDDSKLEKKLLQVLLKCDDDFFPSLSSKRSVPKERKDCVETKLEIYLEEKKETHCYILAWFGSELVGFLNFINNYSINYLPDYPKSNFVDTICVLSEFRNMGIGKRLYKYLETEVPNSVLSNYITLETWSTNIAQINLLNKMGYQLIHRIRNARAEGIDTLIYSKKLKPKSKQ